MQTYISMLRGINLGGHKKILMNDLKALYEAQGFHSVQTYIQSGNVIFQAEAISTLLLARQIEAAIAAQYPFEVPVIIRTREEMQATLVLNPYISQNDIDTEKLHLTFLEDMPESVHLAKINPADFAPDSFTLIGKDVHLHLPIDYGNSKLSNTFFEKKLKVKATTRNWRTVNKLCELAG